MIKILDDFFQGWCYLNSIISFEAAISGLLTGSVLMYADNIRKSFCQNLAICGTVFLSIFLGESMFTIELVIGTVLVVLAIIIYINAKKEMDPIDSKEKVNEDVETCLISENSCTISFVNKLDEDES